MSSHYNHGYLPLAFVFSVPGAVESNEHRPVSGATGENLSIALTYLHSWVPHLFESLDRYAYRITNTYVYPIAKSLGYKYSEARKADVVSFENIDRVRQDIVGCSVVVLCGLRAQLLSPYISTTGIATINAWHTSNQALSKKYNTLEIKGIPNATLRRNNRSRLWAKDLANLVLMNTADSSGINLTRVADLA